MRFFGRSVVGLFILAVTLGLLAYGALMVRGAVEARISREARVPPQRERVFSVNAHRIALETITPVITAYGEVQSRRTLEIRPAVGGTVTFVSDRFVEGGRFERGEVMLRIDDADVRAAKERAETDMRDAEAEARDAARALELARDELENAREQAEIRARALERQRNLKTRGVGTDAAVEAAEIAASSAKATVLTRRQALAQAEARLDSSATRAARARIALSEAQRRLGETQIVARFDGVLSAVNAAEGRLVSPNERLGELVDPSDLEVAFRVSTQDYTRLLTDDGALKAAPVAVLLDDFGVDLTAKGELGRAGAANTGGETGRALFARLERAAGFKPGDFVTVEIAEAPLERVARLPATALGAGQNVLLIGEDGRLSRETVQLLRRQGDDVIVRAPELEGQLVVAKLTPLLGPGIKVSPVEGDATAAPPPEPELIELSDERREKLINAVKANGFIPDDVKTRLLTRLAEEKVPAKMVERIESRMGG